MTLLSFLLLRPGERGGRGDCHAAGFARNPDVAQVVAAASGKERPPHVDVWAVRRAEVDLGEVKEHLQTSAIFLKSLLQKRDQFADPSKVG